MNYFYRNWKLLIYLIFLSFFHDIAFAQLNALSDKNEPYNQIPDQLEIQDEKELIYWASMVDAFHGLETHVYHKKDMNVLMSARLEKLKSYQESFDLHATSFEELEKKNQQFFELLVKEQIVLKAIQQYFNINIIEEMRMVSEYAREADYIDLKTTMYDELISEYKKTNPADSKKILLASKIDSEKKIKKIDKIEKDIVKMGKVEVKQKSIMHESLNDKRKKNNTAFEEILKDFYKKMTSSKETDLYAESLVTSLKDQFNQYIASQNLRLTQKNLDLNSKNGDEEGLNSSPLKKWAMELKEKLINEPSLIKNSKKLTLINKFIEKILDYEKKQEELIQEMLSISAKGKKESSQMKKLQDLKESYLQIIENFHAIRKIIEKGPQLSSNETITFSEFQSIGNYLKVKKFTIDKYCVE